MGGSQVDFGLSTPAQALQNDYPGLSPSATNIQQPSEEVIHEELYPTFSYRIRESFARISKLPTSSVRRKYLKQKDVILSALDMYTWDHFREMFDQDDPPSFQDLVELEWENDTRVGVYTKTIFEPNAAGKPRLERPHFTYVGSATQREGGLAAHKRKHNSPSKREKKSFHTYLVHGDVKRTSKFGVLFSVPTNGLNHQEFMTIRQIYIVAEAVFADILGGYSDHVRDTRLHQPVYGDT
ncbi:uncharacterized protein BDV14DRAFT_200167 [Aspergillus stella-maris]|uniref:uncharacterized protein n=1 Tax=Aspergillus stella-maris TaxID=1810926 RepID=UPI003CCDD2FE